MSSIAKRAPSRMTPRERVLSALSHRSPDRVPFSWGFGPTPEMGQNLQESLAERGVDWHQLQIETEDVLYIGPNYIGPELPQRTNIWGIRRRPVRYEQGAYDEIEHYPLAGVKSVMEVDSFPWPDADAYDYDKVKERALSADPERLRAKKLASGNPFEIYCWMTGLEEAMSNLLLNPEAVVSALERITEFFEKRLLRTLAHCADFADICFLADDLGGQNGLLMSRDLYKKILQPFHRRLIKTAKRMAPHAWIMLHSDGAVFDILPDIIDVGVEILEAVQTDAAGMDPTPLKRAYGNQLSFHGGVSVQSLLPHEDKATVIRECRRLVSVLGDGGGYIAAPSHAIQVGTPPENVLAMLRAILGEADYQAVLQRAQSKSFGIVVS